MLFLSSNEKKDLLEFARFCLEDKFGLTQKNSSIEQAFIKKYSMQWGVFVSLYYNNKLRGCLGKLSSQMPLYKTIQEMSLKAATQDYRFKTVSKNEVPKLLIEISIIGPLQKIKNISQIEIGQHGIYIVKNNMNGTFLPQVAINNNWDREEYLGHCSESKVGIGWYGWRTADIFIYETIVFKEVGDNLS